MTKYAGADWLQNRIKYELSPLARDVADIMGQMEGGLYNWEKAISSKGWEGDDRINLNYNNELLGTTLTLLVLLCHSKKIQITIRPCSPTAIGLSFVKADEQPTINMAIAMFTTTVEALESP